MDGKGELEDITRYLQKKQADFDKVAFLSREIIRTSGVSITEIHNGDIVSAEEKMVKIEKLVEEIKEYEKDFAYYSIQAYQEYAEAKILYGIKVKGSILPHTAIDIPKEAYLYGLLDVAGELKREIIDALTEGDVKTAESYYDSIKTIYDSTRSMRFAEAVLPGFRRKQDVARIQLESAGSEILFVKNRGNH
jgi:translin